MKTALVWFKNDLRSQDNLSLRKAIEENDRVIAVYFFDPRQFSQECYGFKKTAKYRARFLLETVEILSKSLENLNITLLTYHNEPEQRIASIINDYRVRGIYLQQEWTDEEKQISEKIKQHCPENLSWNEVYDQFLFHPDDIPFTFHNIPPVFTNFRKKLEKYANVRNTIAITPLSPQNKIDNPTHIPSLKNLGFQEFKKDHRSAFPYRGGETEALKRIQEYFWDTKKLSYYKKTRNGLLGTDYSSKLSAWLANGSISARTIYHEVKKYEQQMGKNDSTYWLIFELIWRDFFKYISLKHGNSIFKIGGILRKEYDWKSNPELIQQWINGLTKEPFVNANMIELKETGWMSNRGRQNVASFFAKEQELDWRIGAAYFESLLIDYDVHSNYGNWMYVAGVGNDPRDRKFNIATQAERYDPQQKFQNHWLQTTLL